MNGSEPSSAATTVNSESALSPPIQFTVMELLALFVTRMDESGISCKDVSAASTVTMNGLHGVRAVHVGGGHRDGGHAFCDAGDGYHAHVVVTEAVATSIMSDSAV